MGIVKRIGRLTAAVLMVSVLLGSVPCADAANLSSSVLSSTVGAADAGASSEVTEQMGDGLPVAIVHRNAYASSAVVGCLENGSPVTVLGSKKTWYKIDLAGEMKGYIAMSQVAQDADGNYYVNCDPDSSQTRKLPTMSPKDALSTQQAGVTEAKKYLGVRYVWGGSSPKGFDCSGLTQYVMNKVGIAINRSALQQLQNGLVIAKSELQPGDMVFFSNTGGRGFCSHVGIYIGNDQIIHAGDNGVNIARLSSSYFASHYLCARRVIITDDVGTEPVTDVGASQNVNSAYWRENSRNDNGSGNFYAVALAHGRVLLYNKKL